VARSGLGRFSLGPQLHAADVESLVVERSYQAVARAIDDLLNLDATADKVAKYFEPSNNYAGETFTTLSNNDPHRFSVEDLLAVALLETPFSGSATRTLLDNPATLVDLLHGIPDGPPIWSVNKSTLGPVSAADTLWHELDALEGVGPTRAGKLMARKRPALIPIVDTVVEGYLPAPPSEYWLAIRSALLDQERRERIDRLGPRNPAITTLRRLDVAIWMYRRQAPRHL